MDYKTFVDRLNIPLNSQQKEALTNINGHTLLLAVPGSGKTTTLVCRIGYMIYVEGINPSNILIITFTKAAAEDMRDRYASIFGRTYAGQLHFLTINAFCQRSLYKYCQQKSLSLPRLIDDNGSIVFKLFREIYNAFPAENEIKGMQLAITRAKNLQMDEKAVGKMIVEDKPVLPIYTAYQRYLAQSKQMDYDDQLIFAYEAFTKDPRFLSQLQDIFPYILVDEAQDTSRIQHRIIDLLASKHESLFMVGDEDQSIYEFRAAYPEALLEFSHKYADAQVLRLEQNYRSTPEIVALSNTFIKQNKRRYNKNMFTERESGEKVKFLQCQRRDEQYSSLAQLLKSQKTETAVIYRNNASAIPLIAELMRQKVPFRCRGMDTAFFNNKTVLELKKIMLSALDPFKYKYFWETYSLFDAHISKKAAYNAVNAPDLRGYDSIWSCLASSDYISRNYKEGVRKIAKVLAQIRKNNNAREAIYMICSAGYKRADDDRVFILSTLADKDESITNFIARLDELEQAMIHTSYNRSIPTVLTTVHSCKGLEYDNVIIMDEISPVFPDERSDLEEERRLFYVAMTRAKNRLMLLSYNNEQQPFIDMLESISKPKDNAGRSDSPGNQGGSSPNFSSKSSKYVKDARIYHYIFGKGQIIEVDNDIATIRFDVNGIRKLGISICEEQRLVKFM